MRAFLLHMRSTMDNQLLSDKQVLVVEDEMLVAMQIEDMLFDLGCSAVTAISSVETAITCIESNRFDFVTLDLNLNGIKSYSVAEALRERQIPFAFSTGYGPQGIDEEYRNHPILAKPYTHLQLERVISKLLPASS